MRRASGAESLVGSQAVDLPCLCAPLTGVRTLGRPRLPNQTFAVTQAPPPLKVVCGGTVLEHYEIPQGEGPTCSPCLEQVGY